MSVSNSRSAPMRMLSAASGTQHPVLISVLEAMEFVTVRAGEREGSAVFFPAEKLVCLPVQTARRLGLELFEHVDEPPAPTGLQRVDCLDSPSECPSFLGYVRPFVPRRSLRLRSVRSSVLYRGVNVLAHHLGPRSCSSSSVGYLLTFALLSSFLRGLSLCFPLTEA